MERLTADRPSLFFAGPAFFAALLSTGAPMEAFSSVRLATSAGEALPAEIYRFTGMYGVDIIDGLGSTEALPKTATGKIQRAVVRDRSPSCSGSDAARPRSGAPVRSSPLWLAV